MTSPWIDDRRECSTTQLCETCVENAHKCIAFHCISLRYDTLRYVLIRYETLHYTTCIYIRIINVCPFMHADIKWDHPLINPVFGHHLPRTPRLFDRHDSSTTMWVAEPTGAVMNSLLFADIWWSGPIGSLHDLGMIIMLINHNSPYWPLSTSVNSYQPLSESHILTIIAMMSHHHQPGSTTHKPL